MIDIIGIFFSNMRLFHDYIKKFTKRLVSIK